MNKPGLIIILSLVAVAGATGIYFVLKDDKKKLTDPFTEPGKKAPGKQPPPPPPTPTTKPPVTVNQPLTPTPTPTPPPPPVSIPQKYGQTKAFKDLKENIGKGYYAMELICNPNGTNAPINCKSGNALDPGLAQGVWLQFVRQAINFRKQFTSQPSVQKDKSFYAWGINEIAKFQAKTDLLFPPLYFNTNQPFYAQYLANGGTPIPV